MGNSNSDIPVPEGIYALANPNSGITALNMNCECNLFGRKTYFNMTSFESFAIINDAPVEKEVVKEKEGSLWGNLLSGLVVAVVLGACAIALAAAAIATPATAMAAALGMGAAIFGGASLGALAVTISATEADNKSKQVRSWMNFMGDIAKGSMIGGMTGATIYGLWVAAPIVGEALGLQMSMWIGTSTFTAITIPKIGLGLGYTLMGLEGIRGLNEISSIESGQNWILEKVFGGNERKYTTTSMILDLISMGYVQVGMDNIALNKNNDNSETGITDKANSVNRNSAVYSEEIKDIRSLWTEKDIEAFNKLSKEECEVYVKAINNEAKVTQKLQTIVEANGGRLEGLEYRLKSPSSIFEKIYLRPQKTSINEMKDIVRYTEIQTPDKLVNGIKTTLSELELNGYEVTKIKNTWTNPQNPYNGINVQVVSPDGQSFEIQFHTSDSFLLKNSPEMHGLYEQSRILNPNSIEYIECQDKMFELSSQLEIPKNIETIENFER